MAKIIDTVVSYFFCKLVVASKNFHNTVLVQIFSSFQICIEYLTCHSSRMVSITCSPVFRYALCEKKTKDLIGTYVFHYEAKAQMFCDFHGSFWTVLLTAEMHVKEDVTTGGNCKRRRAN